MRTPKKASFETMVELPRPGEKNRLPSMLWFILLAALALRLYGIDFGLPELLHIDEPFEMHRALKLASGSLDLDRAGKGGFYFLILGELAFSFIILLLSGRVENSADFAFFFIRHEGTFYQGARIISALIGAASVYLCYRIVSDRSTKRAGIIAAFLFGGSCLHVVSSHYATVETTLVFCLLATWCFIFKLSDHGSSKNAALTGFFGGLALVTKLPAALIVLPMSLAVIPGYLRGNYSLKKTVSILVIMFSCFTITAFAGEPGYARRLVNFKQTYHRLFSDRTPPSQVTQALPEEKSKNGRNLYNFYGSTLKREQGWLMLTAFFGAAAICLFSSPLMTGLLLSFAVPYLVIICSTSGPLYYARYLLPVIPLMHILTAVGLDTVLAAVEKRSGNAHAAWALGAVFLIAISCHSYTRSFGAAEKLANVFTQISALNWIEARIPPGRTIHMEGNVEHRSQYDVPLLNTGENIEAIIGKLEESAPGKARYWKLRSRYLETVSRPRYALSFTPWNKPYPGIRQLRQSGIEYLVVNMERISGRKTSKVASANMVSRTGLHRQLQEDPQVTMMAEFTGSPRRRGPHLAVYRITGRR